MSVPIDHHPADGALGSFAETRAWQARLIFRRTTPTERLAILEDMLDETGDNRVRDAIERKIEDRIRRFNLSAPIDR